MQVLLSPVRTAVNNIDVDADQEMFESEVHSVMRATVREDVVAYSLLA